MICVFGGQIVVFTLRTGATGMEAARYTDNLSMLNT